MCTGVDDLCDSAASTDRNSAHADSAGSPPHGHGALRIVALRDSRRPGLVAASGQTRWPPARRSRGAALTLTLNTAGPLTGARSRWHGTASPARLTHVPSITTYLAANR